MAGPDPHAAPGAEGRHLLLYDGLCGLCDRLVQFVLSRDRRRLFLFAALQSRAGRRAVEGAGRDADALTTFYVLSNYQTSDARLLSRGRAAIFVLRALGWPWRAAEVLRLLPNAVLDASYDLVARHRYRLFGRDEQCLVPREEYRNRFIQ